MLRRRKLIYLGNSAVLAFGLSLSGCAALAQDTTVPTFEVNPLWPQPLPYPLILGPVSGVTIAPDGNILIVHRNSGTAGDGFSGANEVNSTNATGTCCTPAPAVIEYRPDGTIVRMWGGPGEGYVWPQRPHGIAVDPQGNVWIGGGVVAAAAGGGGPGGGGGGGGGGGAAAAPARPPIDSHILKFSREGQYIATIGTPNAAQQPNSNGANFGGANSFHFDADANEVYVADGLANRRVVVLDATTGAVKRSWGAYGNQPNNSEVPAYAPGAPAAQQFRTVTCAEVSNDDLVYVCDRGSNRIQVFRTDGTFVSERVIAPNTLSLGSVWDVAFSADPQQRYLYVADGMNERVYILDRRSMQVRTSFGIGGRVPGTFHELGSLAVDAQGNLYTAENGQGRRVQKFNMTGTARAQPGNQGALWPE